MKSFSNTGSGTDFDQVQMGELPDKEFSLQEHEVGSVSDNSEDPHDMTESQEYVDAEIL